MFTEDAVPCGCIDKFIVAGKRDLTVNSLTWERAEVLPETQGKELHVGVQSQERPLCLGDYEGRLCGGKANINNKYPSFTLKPVRYTV